jgi:hypothetical protein
MGVRSSEKPKFLKMAQKTGKLLGSGIFGRKNLSQRHLPLPESNADESQLFRMIDTHNSARLIESAVTATH